MPADKQYLHVCWMLWILFMYTSLHTEDDSAMTIKHMTRQMLQLHSIVNLMHAMFIPAYNRCGLALQFVVAAGCCPATGHYFGRWHCEKNRWPKNLSSLKTTCINVLQKSIENGCTKEFWNDGKHAPVSDCQEISKSCAQKIRSFYTLIKVSPRQ
jgi:hypothetical protein